METTSPAPPAPERSREPRPTRMLPALLGVCSAAGLLLTLWFFFWTTPLSFVVFAIIAEGALAAAAALYAILLVRDLVHRRPSSEA